MIPVSDRKIPGVAERDPRDFIESFIFPNPARENFSASAVPSYGRPFPREVTSAVPLASGRKYS